MGGEPPKKIKGGGKKTCSHSRHVFQAALTLGLAYKKRFGFFFSSRQHMYL